MVASGKFFVTPYLLVKCTYYVYVHYMYVCVCMWVYIQSQFWSDGISRPQCIAALHNHTGHFWKCQDKFCFMLTFIWTLLHHISYPEMHAQPASTYKRPCFTAVEQLSINDIYFSIVTCHCGCAVIMASSHELSIVYLKVKTLWFQTHPIGLKPSGICVM